MAANIDFIDGFSHYALAELTAKWASQCQLSGVTLLPTGGSRGTGAIRFGNSFGYVAHGTSGSTHVFGVRIKPTLSTTVDQIFGLIDATASSMTTQCSLSLNADGTLSVRRGDHTTGAAGTSAITLPNGVWSYVEWKVTIANSISAGTCRVYVNGVLAIDVAAGQDLSNTSTSGIYTVTATSFTLGPHANSGATYDAEDFYHGTGTDVLGDCRVDVLRPNGAGTHSQFVASAGNAFECVDDTLFSASDYISSNTVGHKSTFAHGDLAVTPGTIHGVAVNVGGGKTDAGVRTVRAVALNAGSEGLGTVVGMPSMLIYQHVFATDPNGAAPWTALAINAAEFGVKIES